MRTPRVVHEQQPPNDGNSKGDDALHYENPPPAGQALEAIHLHEASCHYWSEGR